MHTSKHIYHHDTLELQGYLAQNQTPTSSKSPAVLVVHDWSGCNSFAQNQAVLMAQQGWIGFAIDMFGQGQVGSTVQEKQALMTPLMSDRALLLARIQAALDEVRTWPAVDPDRIGVLGFCFGGLCALDLARSGAHIKGVVSVHGLLMPPPIPSTSPIQAKILALHGYDDPMVKPTDVLNFCQEMKAANVDWQMHCFGQTQHAFTNPQAHDHALGTVYNARSAQRSSMMIQSFFNDL